VIVEADGQRLALEVDELLGQQQVVVKNLETNYRRVPGVSGATILGDGRVAHIVDPNGVAQAQTPVRGRQTHTEPSHDRPRSQRTRRQQRSRPKRRLPDGSVAGGEFLTFALSEEEYGVDILKVQEIRGYDAVTRLPDAPAHIKGRHQPARHDRAGGRHAGEVPPGACRLRPTTVMIVLNVGGRVVGMVVDSVSDVIRLADAQVRAVPDVGCPDRAPLPHRHRHAGRSHADPADIERLMASTEMGLVMEEAA
jgi:chemotaxis signal transduction protein